MVYYGYLQANLGSCRERMCSTPSSNLFSLHPVMIATGTTCVADRVGRASASSSANFGHRKAGTHPERTKCGEEVLALQYNQAIRSQHQQESQPPFLLTSHLSTDHAAFFNPFFEQHP